MANCKDKFKVFKGTNFWETIFSSSSPSSLARSLARSARLFQYDYIGPVMI